MAAETEQAVESQVLQGAAQSILGRWARLLACSPNDQQEIAWFLESFNPDDDHGTGVALPDGAVVSAASWVASAAIERAAEALGMAYAPAADVAARPDDGSPLAVFVSPDHLKADLPDVLEQVAGWFNQRAGHVRRRCLLTIFVRCGIDDEAASAGQARGFGFREDRQLEADVRQGQFQVISDLRVFGDDVGAHPSQCWRVLVLTPEPRLAVEAGGEITGVLSELLRRDPKVIKLLSQKADVVCLEPGDPLFVKSNRAEYVFVLCGGGLNVYYRRSFEGETPKDEVALRAAKNRPVGDWEMGVPLQRGRYDGTAIASSIGTRAIRIPRQLFLNLLKGSGGTFGGWLYTEFLRNNYDGAEIALTTPSVRSEFSTLARRELRKARAAIIEMARYVISETERLRVLDPNIELFERGQSLMWPYESTKLDERLLNAIRQARYISWSGDGKKNKPGGRANYRWAHSNIEDNRSKLFDEFLVHVGGPDGFQDPVMEAVLNFGRDHYATEEEKASHITLFSIIKHFSEQRSHVVRLEPAKRFEFAIKASVAFHIMRWLTHGASISLLEPFALHEVHFDKHGGQETFVAKLRRRRDPAALGGGWPDNEEQVPLAEGSPVATAELVAGMQEYAHTSFTALSNHLMAERGNPKFTLPISDKIIVRDDVIDRNNTFAPPGCFQDLVDQTWATTYWALKAYELHDDAVWLFSARADASSAMAAPLF